MELIERIDKQGEDAKKSLGFHSLFDDNDAAAGSKELLDVLQDCKATIKELQKNKAELESWADNVMALGLSAVAPFTYTKHTGGESK